MPLAKSDDVKFLCGHDGVDELKPSVGYAHPASVRQKSKWTNTVRGLDKDLGVMLLVGVFNLGGFAPSLHEQSRFGD